MNQNPPNATSEMTTPQEATAPRTDVAIRQRAKARVASISNHNAERSRMSRELTEHAREACEACEFRVVRISARQEADSIRIDVSDTGVGIEASQLGNLFQHGFTTKASGHGFGLHASAITATELGGSLSANSDGFGQGATFTLRVPLTQVKTPEETAVSR